MNLTVRQISAEDTVPLRRQVLRPWLSPEDDVLYKHDTAPGTAHFGAFLGDKLVATVSFVREPKEDGGAGQWRLRAMATDAEYRGRGAGRAALAAGLEYVRRQCGQLLWCHAREAARGFYEKQGFRTVNEPFMVKKTSVHFVMEKALP